MAELLYRIGHLAARRHWTVIGAWLAVLVLTGVTYASFAGAVATATLPPSAERMLTARPVPEYRTSLGPWKTEARPSSW